MAKLNDIRIGDAAEYGREGFVVEQFIYGSLDEPHWCVPGWVEDRWGVSGFFVSEAEARDFIEMIAA